MPDDSYDILRRAVIQALGARPPAERRRQIAADLRALAEQQERMAARDTAGDSAPPPRAGTAREAGFYVRLKHEQDPQTGALRLRVSLGQAIWSAIGGPDRIDVQRVGPNTWIVAASGKAGYPLALGMGLPSCVMANAGPLAELLPGRYAASLHAGAIVLGERVG
jgi:hypothetical protein